MFHKYIDIDNYEIRNNIFEVDEKIANTISLLNKKGYRTTFSCSGHNEQFFRKEIIYKTNKGLKMIEDNLEVPVDMDEINRLKIEPYGVDIIEKEDKYVIYYEIIGTSTYVSFDKDYKFKTLPEKFEKSPSWDNKKNEWSKTVFDQISKEINYYNSNNERKTKEEIEKEVIENNKYLYEWAKTLPYLK